MSDNNLLLFPKKRKSVIEMTANEAKFMITGSLLVVLTLAIGINATLFSGVSDSQTMAEQTTSLGSRSIASINPLFKVSWEKRAFEVLDQAKARELATVGQKPSAIENLSLGTLKGYYKIQEDNGLIRGIAVKEGASYQAKSMDMPINFIQSHLGLFATNASSVKEVHQEKNGDLILQRFQLASSQGQELALVQVIRDKNQKLLSITVQ